MAYLNAKSSFYYDLNLLKGALTGSGRLFLRERKDRLNLFYVLESWATSRSHANHPLVVFEGRSHTYAAVYDRVLRYGNWMKTKLGVRPKDIVAIDFQNSDTFVFMWFALWSIGAKPAFINYNLTGNALAHCIKEATTKLCLIDSAVASHFDDSIYSQLSDIKFVVFSPEVEAEAKAASPVRAPDADRSESDLSKMAILIYTSGTTGLPKAAIVSWGKCVVGSSMTETLLPLNKKEIIYTSMPLYHSSAAILSFLAALHGGATQALGRKFSTKNFWPEVKASNATMIQYVGETLRYLLSAPPQLDPVTGENTDKHHRVRVACGNGLRPDVWNKFKSRFGIETVVELYAATEGTLATFNVSSNDSTSGAIGRNGWLYGLAMARRIAIVDVDWDTDEPYRDPTTGLGRKVKPGEPGEMLFNLPADEVETRFQGYYNNPGATQKKVIRNLLSKGDAWFRTGDVVRWNADGLLYFNDRIGDTYRWKAENVSTAEVSHAVGLHPAVLEANVYGVELPHHDGRAGCAAVYMRSTDEATMRSLATHVRTSLPRFAVPLFLRVLEGEPGSQVTGTNKQQKNALRAAGVKPGEGKVFWLGRDAYVPFEEKELRELEGGSVKL